jgi:hypothetical protein
VSLAILYTPEPMKRLTKHDYRAKDSFHSDLRGEDSLSGTEYKSLYNINMSWKLAKSI